MKKNLVIFCGARFPNVPADELALLKIEVAAFVKIISADYNLVYGGGNIGLMGFVATEFLNNKAHVTGVIPGYLNTIEILHEHITETQVVDDLHQRKAMMEHLGDVFLILPGGIGTLDELCEVLTLQSLHRHKKLVCIWNWKNLFAGFLQFVETGISSKLIDDNLLKACLINENLGEIQKKLVGSKANLG
ncbi:MAG: TIGR00730 family Rossman fold protein [Bdellovibrionaceae bacterium]|nr:TIGR00730 family Rossman fold protein [Bdellovibrio sp.]